LAGFDPTGGMVTDVGPDYYDSLQFSPGTHPKFAPGPWADGYSFPLWSPQQAELARRIGREAYEVQQTIKQRNEWYGDFDSQAGSERTNKLWQRRWDILAITSESLLSTTTSHPIRTTVGPARSIPRTRLLRYLLAETHMSCGTSS
jgi:hypothetical protein